jgi:hypothetical protein
MILQQVGRKIQSAIRRPNYREKVSFLEGFHSDFSRVVRLYTRQYDRIVVMIEDLDRCDPVKSAELLKAINLLIPDPVICEAKANSVRAEVGPGKLIFVIAIDRAKVAAGLAASHESLGKYVAHSDQSDSERNNIGDVLAYWYEYLEKFVQLPFRLPRGDGCVVEEYIRHLVNTPNANVPPLSNNSDEANGSKRDIIDSDGQLVESIVTEMAPYLGYNPRRLKQFLGLFRLRYHVLGSGLGADLALEDTLRLVGKSVAFELLWPRLVDQLGRDPEIICDLERLAHKEGVVVDGRKTVDARLRSWSKDQRLMQFLRLFDAAGGMASKYIPWAVGITRRLDTGSAEPS